MIRDVFDYQDFTVLVETSEASSDTLDVCGFEEPVLGVAFYGAGNVDLTVRYGDKARSFSRTQGMALSFYADENVDFEHLVSASKPLECILIATKMTNLTELPKLEGELFGEMLGQLVNPNDHYVEGPNFFMPPEMQACVDQLFNTNYQGKAKVLFFKNQVTTLLAHFFGQLSQIPDQSIPSDERQKLNLAKDILNQNFENPPSLTELAQEIGLNTFKLKTNFKAMFGLPVFKYLQNERLTKAHDLIQKESLTIQEAAWQVGYDSLSSFSNAFHQKFGYRPSRLSQ
ncbi:helix-turn-helix transcriptional regulator [Reichenbachiella versicolor]|uniref:helix-turn-helix transcriptional regulator n=1 Tax=Reichenbachiella versicolor TaxID=1821036 RepID=UPI000D6E1919|nr:AraC family transcriptional regulator [Reichenbachiella versicolor]